MSHHQWLTVFVIELAKPINLVLKFMFQNLKLIGRQKLLLICIFIGNKIWTNYHNEMSLYSI